VPPRTQDAGAGGFGVATLPSWSKAVLVINERWSGQVSPAVIDQVVRQTREKLPKGNGHPFGQSLYSLLATHS